MNVSGSDGENGERHDRRRWPLRKEYVMMFVASEEEVRLKIESEDRVTKWMDLNGLTMADLTAVSAPA